MNDLSATVERGGTSPFDEFVGEIEPRLRRALVGAVGVVEAGDATAEALAWAWEHWAHVSTMRQPVAYLYRVGRSRSRRRKVPLLPAPDVVGLPDIEPRLVPSLLALPERQRVAVWLVHACDWTYGEVAHAMGLSRSAVGTHVARGLARLRGLLEEM